MSKKKLYKVFKFIFVSNLESDDISVIDFDSFEEKYKQKYLL